MCKRSVTLNKIVLHIIKTQSKNAERVDDFARAEGTDVRKYSQPQTHPCRSSSRRHRGRRPFCTRFDDVKMG